MLASGGGGGEIDRCLYMYKFVGYPFLNKVYFSEVVFFICFIATKKVMFPQKEFFAVFFAA